MDREKIIKALECCSNYCGANSCAKCPKWAEREFYKPCNIASESLALIKELTKDVERVSKQCGEIIVECDERDAERLKQVGELMKENKKLKAESMVTTSRTAEERIQRLIKEHQAELNMYLEECSRLANKNSELTMECERYKRYFLNHEYDKMEAEVRADTVQKYAKRLKETFDERGFFSYYIILENIDQIAKEIIE